MNRAEVIDVLLALAEGVNPETGEFYETSSPFQSARVVRALYSAVREPESGLEQTAASPAVTPPKPSISSLPPLKGEDLELYETLRQWRARVASHARLPAYAVVLNRTLHGIAVRRPRSAEELLEIRGIGPAKLEKYAPEILQLLEGHAKSQPQPHEVPSGKAGWLDPSPEQQEENRSKGIRIATGPTGRRRKSPSLWYCTMKGIRSSGLQITFNDAYRRFEAGCRGSALSLMLTLRTPVVPTEG